MIFFCHRARCEIEHFINQSIVVIYHIVDGMWKDSNRFIIAYSGTNTWLYYKVTAAHRFAGLWNDYWVVCYIIYCGIMSIYIKSLIRQRQTNIVWTLRRKPLRMGCLRLTNVKHGKFAFSRTDFVFSCWYFTGRSFFLS